MTQIQVKKLTFEEYLTYDDNDTDNFYELVDGELVMVPLPTGDHSDVIDLLFDIFKAEINQEKLFYIVKRDVGVYIGINPKTGKERSRTPDLCILAVGQWAAIKSEKTKAAVSKTAPLLVVEVVSPCTKTTDYETKKQEYEKLAISEYWIVDQQQSKVTILILIDNKYQTTEFNQQQRIISPTFPGLTLCVNQIMSV